MLRISEEAYEFALELVAAAEPLWQRRSLSGGQVVEGVAVFAAVIARTNACAGMESDVLSLMQMTMEEAGRSLGSAQPGRRPS